MRNLIYVNMMRLKKSRIFWAGVIVSMVYSAFLLVMNFLEISASPEAVIEQIDWYFAAPFAIAGAFGAVFGGMFLGTEYNDGTMRNKLMVGHTRKEIYGASLMILFLANVFVYLAGCLVVVCMGIPVFGWHLLQSPAQFSFRIFSGILMLAAHAGIFTFLSMAIDSKAGSTAACMVFYALSFIGTSFLQTAVYSYYTDVPWEHVPGEAIQPFLEFIYDFLPSAQGVQIAGAIMLHPYRLPLYSLICVALTCVCGITIFAQKDIK